MPRRPSSRSKKQNTDESVQEQAPSLHPEAQKAILIVLFFALGLLAFLSLFGLAGKAGEWLLFTMLLFFGWGKFLFPIVLFALGYVFIYPDKYPMTRMRYVGIILFVLSFFGFLHLFVPLKDIVNTIPTGRGGGYVGLILSWPFEKFLGVWASGVVLVAGFFVSLFLMFNTSFAQLRQRFASFSYSVSHFSERFGGFGKKSDDEDESEDEEDDGGAEDDVDPAQEQAGDQEPSSLVKTDDPGSQASMPLPPRRIRRKIDIPLSLLSAASEKPVSFDVEVNKQRIHQALANFGIDVIMHDVHVGPTVTQYTLKPADGVKLARIVALQRDLSLALAAHPLRIEAPIPGKSLVGIEVPNQSAAVVRLRELLKTNEFRKKRNSNLSLPIGKDVSGEAFYADLDGMPHLLVAGATGSGKSVSINTMIVSMLYQNSPADLKFILVDPKRVELSVYNGIPYLLTPVITEREKTINALKWAVSEMDRRYELLSHTHKRNISAYNQTTADKLPYIVIIIDELADLMAVAANEIEAIIIRLAQMARAVGIHLILATQRPSVDVITGLIKANITSRIAFNVASSIDSRTILDFQGAEKLLGKGDMLYVSADFSRPRRLQGAYLSDEEISAVVQYLKEQGEPEYDQDIVQKHHKPVLPGVMQDSEDDDELLDQAKDVILKSQKASASLLQRRLRVGYARAARILDILEEQGIIGPADGAKAREILVSPEDFDEEGNESYDEPGDDAAHTGDEDAIDESEDAEKDK